MPTSELYLAYLNALKNLTEGAAVTEEEKNHIKGRKLWSDIVYETTRFNKQYTLQHDPKAELFDRIESMGHNNPRLVYDNCTDLLWNKSRLTVSFNASFLKDGLKDYQLLSTWQQPNTATPYFQKREKVENDIYFFLTPEIKREFLKNLHARPRYAALQFFDENTPLKGTKYYGQSFIVLKNIVKLNSVFSPGDSYRLQKNNTNYISLLLSTIHTPELLLWQLSNPFLNALCKTVVEGNINPILTDCSRRKTCLQYIEAQIPAVDLTNPHLIEHIYIDPDEYQISSKALEEAANAGITISNSPLSYK
jgi:hypothetical protein